MKLDNNKLDGLDVANTIDALNHYEMGLVAEGHLKEALIRIIKKLQYDRQLYEKYVRSNHSQNQY